MDFGIKTNMKKKKTEKYKKNKLIILATFFTILTIILLIIYFFMNDKKEIQVEEPIKVVEEKKLTIFDEGSDERPIAIMIDNNIGDAQHAGLQDSYLNYEIIVEGGLTRIMAIYKDKDVELIGPIRSSRHYFLDYALESDAIYTHYGWSTYAENDIKKMKVDNINGLTEETPFWRDMSAIAPHNVFTSTQKIKSYLEHKNYSPISNNWKLLNYSVDEINLFEEQNTIESSEEITPQNQQKVMIANKISIDYSYYQNRSYTYDSENKYYLRSMNGKGHFDKKTNTQLNYKNIIIQKVSNKTLDSEGRQDLTTTGTGKGYYITNGFAKTINWTKTSRNAKTKYTYEDGTEVVINDGNTFIQIVPTTSNIVIE